ncbi:MAG: hypothetical protein ACREQ4_09140 [Candidatus Binataceae bacterium]
METELERTPAKEIAKPPLRAESAPRKNAEWQRVFDREKNWSGVALLASLAAFGTFAGLAWLYFYAVSALQTALSLFKP